MIDLLGKGFWVLVVRSSGAGLAFLSIVVFSRLLGPDEFGLYSLALIIVTIAAVISRWGLDIVLLKQVAANISSAPSVVNGYVSSALILVIVNGAILTGLIWSLSEFISLNIFQKPGLSSSLSILSWVIIPVSIIFVMGEAFKSISRPVYATFLQTVLAPTLTLFIVGSYWYFGRVTLEIIVYSVFFGSLVPIFFYLISWRKNSVSDECKKQPLTSLLRQGWPMLLASSGGLVMAWSDVLILGIFAASGDVGIYSAASKCVLITTLLLVAVNSITGPRFSQLYHQGNIEKIRILAQSSSAVLLIAVSLPFAILFIYPGWVMSWFGEEYVAGASLIVILAIGQLVNVVCGSITYLLSMTGKEHKLRNIMLITAMLNVILSLLAVKKYGVTGVALATAFSVILWNLWAMCEVKKHLGFWAFNPFQMFRSTSRK